MAQGDPPGWDSKGPNDPTRYEAIVPGFTKTTTGGQKEYNQKLYVVTDRSTGNYDVYDVLGNNMIYSYNASNNKIVPKNQNLFNSYFGGSAGQSSLSNANTLIKKSTLKLAENNVSGPQGSISRTELDKLKNAPGYKSIANAPQVQPTPPGGGGTPPGSTPPGSTPPGGTPTATPEQTKALQDESKNYLGRKNYPVVEGSILKYPLNLNTNQQDCIKFTIQKYQESGLSLDVNPYRKVKRTDSLVSIVLPIPAGISDSNRANWQKDDLSVLAKATGDITSNLIASGADAGKNSAENVGKIAFKDPKILKDIIAAKTSEIAVSSLVGENVNILARKYGAVLNPNTELLFTGPELREFTFTFRMTPREEKEATVIKTIIRYFKQAMSAKRSVSNLLLKTPHTFFIEYVFDGSNLHPYLNKFKECALTSCSVNYTPDGTYMTYDGRNGETPMTCYELQLTFQELEPIFDDDYDSGDGLPSNIGY